MSASTRAPDAVGALRSRLLGVQIFTDRPDVSPYCRDWFGDITTDAVAVLRPATTEEVSRCVASCRELGLTIIPQGGNTGLVLGGIPDDPARQVVLSLERMTRIRSMDADDFTVSVDAGCVLEQVKDEAARHGLSFPVSLGAQGSCQIGGNVSTNAGGLNVLRYGMMRQHVLGLEVVLPDGRIWNNMSRLLKDNRGPDLNQLFIGAEGIFGIVTGAKLKLVPKPDNAATALLALGSLEAAIGLYRRARRDCSDLLSAFEFMPPEAFELARRAMPDLPRRLSEEHPVYVLMEISGSGLVAVGTVMERFLERVMEGGAVIDGVLASSSAQARELWLIREGLNEGQALRGRHLRTDVSLPLSQMAAFIAETRDCLARSLPDADPIVYGHIGDGNVHFNVHPVDPMKGGLSEMLDAAKALINDQVKRFGGSISAEHGIGRLKRGDFEAGLSSEEAALLQSLKSTLDPEFLLNPGCLLRGPGVR